ncbi:hypothetical protein [Actinopolymorpha sp. B9G3]|uniref:hypothetical protein n=1 Tax=Actinopolymorpha sp. B9G3 TaxID=3158970 RepID=UPI0032D94ABE
MSKVSKVTRTSRDVGRVRTLMPADPAVAVDRDTEISARVTRRVEALLDAHADAAGRQRGSGTSVARRRVLALGVAGAAGAAVVLADQLPMPGRSSRPTAQAAVTPPVLALAPIPGRTTRQVLRELADKVEKLPPPAVGPYTYGKSWGWDLSTNAEAPGGAESVAVPTVTEQWINNQDGSGRERKHYGRPYFPNPATERARAEARRWGEGIEDTIYPPGHFGRPRTLPSDPQAMAAKLRAMRSQPIEDNGTAQLLAAVATLSGEPKLGDGRGGRGTRLSPEVRAALLRVLADHEEHFDWADTRYLPLRAYTTTTWRKQTSLAIVAQERRGAAPDYPTSTLRETLLLDPETGFVMGYEVAILGHPRLLNLDVPAPLSVRETLLRAPVDSQTDRP